MERARELHPGRARHLSLHNLQAVVQDDEGARCFACLARPVITRRSAVLADGTILCPQCGTDAVVPASEVRNEGELQAWQHMSFPDTRDDEGGQNEIPRLNPFLSRRGDSGSNRQHYPDGDSEPNEAGALLDKDSSTRSCYRGPLVWGHTAACKGGLCLHRTCHEAPAPARRAPPRKPHGQPPPPRRQRRQRQTPARHHRRGAAAPGQAAGRTGAPC